MARDEKGRFLPGNKEGHRFTRNGDARESGAKGTAVREQRKKERQTLADVLRRELEKKAAAPSVRRISACAAGSTSRASA